MKNEKLKAAVIGMGVGEQHIEGYLSHPNCEVVALCDFDEIKYEYTKEKYPDYFVTKDANEILNDPRIDVVSIASYDSFHYEQIVCALENGKHIFVEKPFVLKKWELDNIKKICEVKNDLKISSNLILRMSPRFIKIKELIQQDCLGKLFYVEGDYNYGRLEKITEGWRGDIPYYSVFLGGGIHLTDLLMWMTNERVVEVYAKGNQIASNGSKFKFNDLCVAMLEFESGMVGKISSNYGCVHPHFHKLSIYGTKATFENHVDGGRIFTSRNSNDSPLEVNEAYPGVHKGGILYSFIQEILSGEKGVVSKEDVFSVMDVCLAIEESIETGMPIKVK